MQVRTAAVEKRHAYSFRREFTGFASAAFNDCQLMVAKATNIAITDAIINMPGPTLTRYAKSLSHWFIAHHVTGIAITIAITTSLMKSLEISVTMPATDEPNTFLIPISFVRCSAVKVARPNNPRHAIKIASAENKLKIFPKCESASYCFENDSSRKLYMNGRCGASLSHIFLRSLMVLLMFSDFSNNEILPSDHG